MVAFVLLQMTNKFKGKMNGESIIKKLLLERITVADKALV